MHSCIPSASLGTSRYHPPLSGCHVAESSFPVRAARLPSRSNGTPGCGALDTWRKQRPLVLLAASSSFARLDLRGIRRRCRRHVAANGSSRSEVVSEPLARRSNREKGGSSDVAELDCVASGMTVECVVPHTNGASTAAPSSGANGASAAETTRGGSTATAQEVAGEAGTNGGLAEKQPIELENGALAPSVNSDSVDAMALLSQAGALLLLISPFFFWGSSMVAMKDVLPRAGPMFVAAFRLIPAGLLLVGFAAWKGRPMPSSAAAWVAIAAFAAVDATCFQGFLTEGLKRTSAGLGSVIIDSQPLTVAVLAALLFGEYLGPRGVAGLALGIVGLCLLEIPGESIAASLSFLPLLSSLPLHIGDSVDGGALVSASTVAAGATSTVAATVTDAAATEWNILESGEWWMLLAAQSMAVGTVMVRWVCKYTDPIMATGWHLVLGGIPLLALSVLQEDPALQPGGLMALSGLDWSLLGYTSVFGSAVSYGIFFYNASRGNLTKLSSLTFLTPAFAALFGYLFLNESFNGQQWFGALVTLLAIYLVNTQQPPEKES